MWADAFATFVVSGELKAFSLLIVPMLMAGVFARQAIRVFGDELGTLFGQLAEGATSSAEMLVRFALDWMNKIWDGAFSMQGIVVSFGLAFGYTLFGALWSWIAGAPPVVGGLFVLPSMPQGWIARAVLAFAVAAWVIGIVILFARAYQIDDKIFGRPLQHEWDWKSNYAKLFVAVALIVMPFVLTWTILRVSGAQTGMGALIVFAGTAIGFVVALLGVGRHPGLVSALSGFALAVAPLLGVATSPLETGWLSLVVIGAFAGTGIGIASLASAPAPQADAQGGKGQTKALVGGSVGAVGGFIAGLYVGLSVGQQSSATVSEVLASVAFVSVAVPVLNGAIDWISVSVTVLLLKALQAWLNAPNLGKFARFGIAVAMLFADVVCAFAFVVLVQYSLWAAAFAFSRAVSWSLPAEALASEWIRLYVIDPFGQGFVVAVMSWSTVVPTVMHLFAAWLWGLGIVLGQVRAPVEARSALAALLAILTLFGCWIAAKSAVASAVVI